MAAHLKLRVLLQAPSSDQLELFAGSPFVGNRDNWFYRQAPVGGWESLTIASSLKVFAEREKRFKIDFLCFAESSFRKSSHLTASESVEPSITFQLVVLALLRKFTLTSHIFSPYANFLSSRVNWILHNASAKGKKKKLFHLKSSDVCITNKIGWETSSASNRKSLTEKLQWSDCIIWKYIWLQDESIRM